MGFLIQLVLGQCMAGLGFMGLWQIQATLTHKAYEVLLKDANQHSSANHIPFSPMLCGT